MTSWFRSWHGAPTDNKWLVIAAKAKVKPGVVSAIAWALFDYASQADDRGSVAGFDAETYATFSGFNESEVQAVVDAMRSKGVIDADGRLAAWDKRQPKREDDSTKRVREYRKRKDSDNDDNANCNALKRIVTHGNNTDTDTDTDTETTTRAPVAENGYFGLPDPRTRRNAQSQQTGDAAKLGVSADVFRQMTDALIDAAGWRAAVDDAGDDAKLCIAKDNAVALVRMGHTTAEQVTALATAYKAANAWRNSPPQPRDLVTYASQVKAGIAPTSKPAANANSDARLSVNDPVIQEGRAKAERERQRTEALLRKLEPMKVGRIAQ
jgi:hypothetical protein